MDLYTKQKLLDNLYIKYKVAICDNGKDTKDLADKKIVKGKGSFYSKLALVSEVPQGNNVTGIINLLGIKEEDVYITNVVKYNTKAISAKTSKQINRPPSKDEIELSAPFLFEELKIIEPMVVATFGSASLKAVTGDNSIKLRDFHGKALEISRLIIYPLYNQKSVMYIKEFNEVYEKDLQGLINLLDKINKTIAE